LQLLTLSITKYVRLRTLVIRPFAFWWMQCFHIVLGRMSGENGEDNLDILRCPSY